MGDLRSGNAKHDLKRRSVLMRRWEAGATCGTVPGMASSQVEIDQATSRVLRERATALGVYSHPTGKGDGREELLRELLQERIGTSFGATKAEVIDSEAASTNEHDIVIYDQSIASCLHVSGQRRIVRVESLAVTVEVKSELKSEEFGHVERTIGTRLGALRRFYSPTRALYLRGVVLSEVSACLAPHETTAPQAAALEQRMRDATDWTYGPRDSVSPCSRAPEVPAVINAIFAYKGPKLATAREWLAGATHVSTICVLGEYAVSKPRVETWEPEPAAGSEEAKHTVVWAVGDEALGAFLYLLEGDLERFRHSRFWFAPDSGKYYKPNFNTIFLDGKY